MGEKVVRVNGIGVVVAIGVIILLAIVGVFGYSLYREREAINSIETRVTGVGVPDLGLKSINIPIEIKFHNTSSYDSPSFTVSYGIYIDDEKVGNGSVPSTSVLANKTETTMQSITVEYADVGAGLSNMLQSGEFTMTMRGEVKAETVFGLIPISQSFKSTYSF